MKTVVVGVVVQWLGAVQFSTAVVPWSGHCSD
jgi:hypothetical protein